MDLRTLIPAVESISAPITAILGDGSGGLSGLTSRVEGQDFGALAGLLGGSWQSAFEAALPREGAGPSSSAAAALGGLSTRIAEVPSDLLSGIQEPLADLGGLLDRLPTLVTTLSRASDAIDAARGGDLGAVLGLAGSALGELTHVLTGPDFTQFADWTAYITELGAQVRPIVVAGGTPDSIRQALLELALDRARETLAGLAPAFTSALGELDSVLGGALADVPSLGLTTLRTATLDGLAGLRQAASGSGDVAAALDSYRTRLFTLTDRLNGALDQLEAGFSHPLLTPGGVSGLAGAEIDRVLATEVSDFSNVHARLQAFYAEIEQTLARVDLSAVTGQVTGFFSTIEQAVQGIDFGAIGGELDEIASEADRLVERLATTLTSVSARITQWLGGFETELTDLLGELGRFDADGSFHFSFQGEIDALFERMHSLIQGDPSRPGEPSIAGALHGLEATLLGFITEVASTLEGIGAELEAVKAELANSLGGVREQIAAVDPTEVMNQAKAALEHAFQEIGDLELDPLVDPVIGELEAARDALSRIDVSELNDLLRAALREVLDAIATSDFDRQLTRPLLREFDELLEGPRALLATFADKLNELIQRVEALSPAALLAPVQTQLDRITAGLDVDLEALLGPPLEAALSNVRRLLARLDPAPLLAPIQSAFDQAMSRLAALQPERLLEPAQAQLGALAAAVRGLDLDRPLAGVNAVFGDIERLLEQIEPTRLLAPLNEPFTRARTVLESLRPSLLLAPLTELMAELGELTGSVPESVAEQARSLYDEALARIDGLDPIRAFAAVRGAVNALRTRVDGVAIPALLTALESEYAATRAALQAADARDGSEFATAFARVEPVRVFGEIILRHDRASSRLRAVLDGLDPAPLAARYAEARGRIDELLPRAIRGDITSSQIQILLDLTDPARLIALLDGTYQRILDQLLSISPQLLTGPLVALHGGLRTLLGGLDVRAVTARVEGLLARIASLVEGISLTQLVAPALDAVERIRSVLRALDPAPIIAGLHAQFDALMDVFEEVSVRAVLAALARGWSTLHERIASLLDLEALFQPLVAITEQIQALIGGLDMGELVGVIDAKLDKLRDELEAALDRTGDAFKAMLAAAPL